MSRTVARSTLRTRIQQRTATENDPDPTTTELNDIINESLCEVYDLLVLASPPDYYSSEATFTTTATAGPWTRKRVQSLMYQEKPAKARRQSAPASGNAVVL